MSGTRSVVVVLLCCLSLASWARPAAAADPAQAKAAFAEGQRLFLAGDFRKALGVFENAYLQSQDPAFLLNIAQCRRSLAEPKEALMMYRLYLKSTPEGTNTQTRAFATKAVGELEAETIGAPGSAAASPSGPDSGRKFQQAPAAYPILDALPAAEVKKAPEAPPPPPASPPPHAGRSLRLAGMAAGAAGVLSVGAGVVFWARARSLSDSASKALIYDHGDYDKGQRAETMQWIFYSVGGAAIATGATLYYLGWRATKKTTVSLVPMLGPGAGGLLAQGAF